MSRTSSPGIYSRSSSKSMPRPLKWLKYAPTMVSFTNRLVRTSTRRTDSKSSDRFMERGRKSEGRRSKAERRPKERNLLRISTFGLLSAFDLRISAFPSWHRHRIKYLFDNRIRRHRLRLGFIGEDEAMA